MIISASKWALRNMPKTKLRLLFKKKWQSNIKLRLGIINDAALLWQTSSNQIQYFFSDNKVEVSQNIIGMDRLKVQIQKDLQSNYSSFSIIKSSFIHHINQKHYNQTNLSEFQQILRLISLYPVFTLDTSTMLAIYKLICYNMHLKSVQTMNNLLCFVLIADPQPSHSPIFHQFLRFYLIMPSELFKFKFQLDFANMSFTQAIRQFFGKLLHRGFLSRTPPYQRNLNVTDPRRMLLLLRKNASVSSTLMVKKLNYTIFLQIKQFYENEMKENLYHQKKNVLMSMFTDNYLQVLSEDVEMTHHESIHLRQLYMKLYLTLPEDETLALQFEKFKYLKVIYLYELAAKHIKSLDHLKLDQINQKIDVVIQFVQCVDRNLEKLLTFKQEQLVNYKLSFQQILLIILWAKKTGKNASVCSKIFNLASKSVNSYTMWHYFELLKDVFQYIQSSLPLQQISQNYDNYLLLTLPQLSTLARIFTNKNTTQYKLVMENVLRKVLSTDFEVIGGQEVIHFLCIYQASLPTIATESNAQALRVFVMRYIADHHKQFSITQFQQILVLLLVFPKEKCMKFDDEQGSYPLSIYQQIAPYVSKVSLLFATEIKEMLENHTKFKVVE